MFMLMFPSDFQEVKYATLILLLMLSTFEFLSRKKNINKNVLIGILLWYTYFLFSLLVGVNKGYNFDFPLISMFFFTPIVALLLASIIDSEERFISLNKMIVVITLIICVLDLVYILNRLTVLSLPFDFSSSIFGSVFVSEEKLEFRIQNQSSLIFLLPYLLALNISHGYSNKKEKYLIWITIFLGLIVALFSGRRALQTVVVLSIILGVGIFLLKKRKLQFVRRGNPIKRIGQILLIVIAIISTYKWLGKVLEFEYPLVSVYMTFLSAFDFSSGGGAIRAAQISALIDGWRNSPIIGYGINSYADNYIRSSSTPWSYEMVYIALLFQAGIIGVLIFFTFVLFILKRLYNRIDLRQPLTNSYFFGILVGFISFIIAGAVNPMVYYVWAWAFALIGYQKFYTLKQIK